MHPTSAAYRELAARVAEKTKEILAETLVHEEKGTNTKRKAEPRDPWIERSQAIAKRLDERGTVRGTGCGRGGVSSRGTRPPHRPFKGR